MRARVTRTLAGAAFLLVLASPRAFLTSQPQTDGGREWPTITNEMKPWTRWWWHGSAVDRPNLTSELEALNAVGIGGVEITPIYGVRGEELRSIPYLSDSWVGMLEHVVREAHRLQLGVDMATGTGWPFGGPWVGDDGAPRTLLHKTWTLAAGEAVAERIRFDQQPLLRALGNQVYEVGEIKPGEQPPVGTAQRPRTRTDARPLQISDIAYPLTANSNLQALALEQIKYPRTLSPIAVMAYGDSGRITDLTNHVDAAGMLSWQATERTTVFALFSGWHGKLVERAAPGGEGNVIDHFSQSAIRSYLARFDRAFAGRYVGVRAFFNDSYEVDDATGQANWTPRFFEEFQTRRGYDLRNYLSALLGAEATDLSSRVVADYRETISDLLLDTFTKEWATWARGRSSRVRNQAHGSPANLLDLYAASDIPETEGIEIPRFKWATSAASVAGRRLVSAEAATWLNEHFRSTLAEIRSALDHFFVAGVNHIVYHGTAYSPSDAPWPGWQFYAAVDFNRRNAWWDDFAALNAYVTRTQSFLQSGRADHDVLLYFPFHDAAAARGNALLTHFGGANRPTNAAAFEAAAATLQSRGFAYDYISDRQLRNVRVDKDRLITAAGVQYRALVVPSSRFIPIDTLEHIVGMAGQGAAIVVVGNGPAAVASLPSIDAREQRFRRAMDSLKALPSAPGTRLAWADVLEDALVRLGIVRERLVDLGLMFARRADAGGRFYFINNRSERAFEGWVPLNTTSEAAIVFDAMTGRRGTARLRRSDPATLEAYLQIPAHESLIVATSTRPIGERYEFYRTDGRPISISGNWSVRFIKGGPAVPAPRQIERLVSWTALDGDDRARDFSGTATYTTTFALPAGPAEAWQLDLGRVHESARVRLNGQDLGTLIGSSFRLTLNKASLRDSNVLEVSVTNLSANRIAELDRRGVSWKKFYNVNMPARFPQNRGTDGLFTAAKWEPLDSGLIGPVTLTPVVKHRP